MPTRDKGKMMPYTHILLNYLAYPGDDAARRLTADLDDRFAEHRMIRAALDSPQHLLRLVELAVASDIAGRQGDREYLLKLDAEQVAKMKALETRLDAEYEAEIDGYLDSVKEEALYNDSAIFDAYNALVERNGDDLPKFIAEVAKAYRKQA
jgi:hypothetical protein